MTQKNKVALLIKANGSEIYLSPKGLTFTLEELQELVGGNIEIVRTTNDKEVMIINEEGKLKELPVNAKATELYAYGSTDVIVGNVLVADKYLVR